MKLLRVLLSKPVMGLVTFVSLGLSVYLGFYYESKPELAVTVESLEKVFDLHRPVGGLEVSYAGENLRLTQTALWVLTIKVQNTGNAGIHKGDYDEEMPLGIVVKGATIAEPPSIKTESDYLRKSLKVSYVENTVRFSPTILEAGEFFETVVLLLGPEADVPTVAPVGKVAGVKSIELLTLDRPNLEKSIWEQITDGASVWAHILRVPVYAIGALLLMFFLMLPLAGILSFIELCRGKKEGRERKEKVKKYQPHETLSKESRYFLDTYEAYGAGGLQRIADYLDIYYRRRRLIQELEGAVSPESLERVVQCEVPMRKRVEEETERELKLAKLVTGDGVNVQVTANFYNAFCDLCEFVELDDAVISKLREIVNSGV